MTKPENLKKADDFKKTDDLKEPKEHEKRFIGQIVGYHGLRGDVKVKATSQEPDWLKTLKKVTWVRGDKTLELEIVRARKKPAGSVIMAFAHYTNRTQVENELAQGELYAEEQDLPQPEEGEYWATDLVGLQVIDEETQNVVGTVCELLTSGARDFLEIQLLNQTKTLLIPFIDEFFPVVDLEPAQKSITVARLSEFIQMEQSDESTNSSGKGPK